MRSDMRFFSRSLCAMFLAVVHKSKRVDTSRTGGSRLVGGWMLDRCAVGSWTAALLEVGPLRCWMLEVGGGVAAG